MADAVPDGDVPAGLDETIDAVDAGGEPARTSLPAGVVAATRDYPQLQPVDRCHYVITDELARGGMGRVVEARDLRLGRQVAIKELLPKNRDAARRFEREARITARLQHPAIIHVYEAGVWPGGEPFYAMPRVAGRSLDEVVAERTTLEARLALLPHVIAVADALAYAHNANVIHRDLKPANVLIGEFGETVVIDWGLAKDLGVYTDPQESMQLRLRASAEETMSGGVVGTPAYMPPEQARGDAVDQRADVYALGALLYKVLVGAAPYTGESARDILDQVKRGPPVPMQEREPGAPPDLVAIVAKAMAREPNARYITASELAQDLKRFETGQLVGAHRYTIGQLVRRWLHRHRVAVAIAVVAALALIAIGVFSIRSVLVERDRAEVQRAKADADNATLLEERGRVELLDGHAGAALADLVAAAKDGATGGARGLLIADAMRPFEAELARRRVGSGEVVVAVSRDGSYFASGGAGPIELWLPDGTRRSFGEHGVTRSLAFDPTGGRLAAAGDDGVLRVWSLDGTLVAELHGHDGAILDVEFSPDGGRLVTAGGDATVRLWNLATRDGRPTAACHTLRVVSARFSHDGSKVVSASEDRTACVFKADSGDVYTQLRGHTASVNAATWSPDDRYVVTASDDGTARVWGPNRGVLLVKPLLHDAGSVVRVALPSSDGHVIVTGGSDRLVRVWELPSELASDDIRSQAPATQASSAKLIEKFAGHGDIVTAAFAADDRQIVTGGFDGLAQIWDRESKQAIRTVELGDVVTALALDPGADRLMTGSRDGLARVWSTKVAGVRPDLASPIHAIAVRPDGTVAAGTDDTRVTLVHGGDKRVLSGHLGAVLAVAFTPDGARLLSGGDDSAVFVWDVATGAHTPAFGAHAQPIQGLAVGPDGDRVALLAGGVIELWSLARGTQLAKLHAPRIDAIAISATTGALAGVSSEGTLRVWDAAGTELFAVSDRGSPYAAVGFAPRGDEVVAAGPGVAHVWNLATHKRDPIEGPASVVRAAVFSADGSLVITAGEDNVASIWDRRKGKLLARRDYHARPVSAVAVAGDTLWVASEDGTLAAWDIRVETRPVAELRRFIEQRVPEHLDHDVVPKQ